MYKAIIFDMDGVLIDSEELHTEAVKDVLSMMGIDSAEVLKKHKVGAKSYGKTWASVKQELGIEMPLEEIIKMQYEYSYDFFKRIDLKEIKGASKLITQLKEKDLTIAVGSSAPVKLIDIILNKLNLSQDVATYCGVEYVKSPKPDPDIYLWIAKELNLRPEQCIVIEDSPSGINSAKSAGMTCIALDRGGFPSDKLTAADFIGQSFEEITSILQGELGC